jgi:very-short-patch-repair endonuclease
MSASVISVRERLLAERRALLDLGTRNRLINVPLLTKGVRTIEIVDEKSAEIYRLLTEGKGLSFLAAKAEGQGLPLEQPAGPRPGGEDVAPRQRDTRLQTRLTAEALQKRLLDLWYDARTLEEEQGVNILYLALGLLCWFEDDKSEEARHAPLILLPVRLDRSSAAERFTLRWRGEPASPNLSIQAKMAADFGLEVEDFPDEDDIDIGAYLAGIAATVSGKSRWSVDPDALVLGFFSFAKFLMYRDLDPENWPKSQSPDQHPLVASLLGDGFEAIPPLLQSGQPLDTAIPPASLNHVVDADSSQAVAIEEAVRGRQLVIKGPPGTGKSQTITNIIAGAALQGKKVLFVAEKMAALDVVHRRLKQAGLGLLTLELHSAKANKKMVLEELRRAREMPPRAGSADRSLLAPMALVQDELNAHAALMHRVMTPSGLTPFQLIGHLIEVKENGGLAGVRLQDAPGWTPQDLAIRRELVGEIAGRLDRTGNPAHHVWRGVMREALDPSEQAHLSSMIKRVEADLATLAQVQAELSHYFPIGVTRIADFDTVQRCVRAATTVPDADRDALVDPIWRRDLGAVSDLVVLGRTWHRLRAAVDMAFTPAAWTLNMAAVRHVIATKGDGLFRHFSTVWRRAQAQLKGALIVPLPRDSKRRLSLLDGLIAAQDAWRRFEAARPIGQQAFGAHWADEGSDWDRLQAQVAWWREHRHPDLNDAFLTRLAGEGRIDEVHTLAAVVAQGLPRLRHDLKALGEFLKLDLQRSLGVLSWEDVDVGRLGTQLKTWQDNLESISRWVAFAGRIEAAGALGLRDLADAVMDGELAAATLVPTFERSYFEQVRDDFFNRIPGLKRFDGDLHLRRIENFRALDMARMALARDETALKHAAERPQGGGGIGPLGVLNGEFAKKRNHLPIRQLLDRAGPVIQQLKPVMMMSPLSISQFLKPGAMQFDLLVIDEASQVEPIDALGAIARARQIVVVGDERQLPPTRFFAKLTSEFDEIEYEDAPTFKARDAESILDLCLAKGVPHRLLNWHYRSKHQSLIAVSNREFYENRLLIVPSPHQGGLPGGPGLHFHYLADAIYDRGNTRTNPVEARCIVDAVIAHARQNGDLSLGVATFSVAQRQAILKELELRRKHNPDTEDFFNRHGHEPFFVKNLENIQGDERDVIFISVGYGRSSAGYLAMSFGPLNVEGGERRLNVLISRAKIRCEVFSSIKGEDITLEKTTARGVAALKLFLTFAQMGHLDIPERTERPPDSLFEEQVARALRDGGHTVEAQIGSAGFYVDLAITDPGKPERYLLGIECDGAQYHSSRTARDRDRLRQAVLEDHGWIIHRIWSTDWFLRPKAELTRFEAALAAARQVWQAREAALAAPRGEPATDETKTVADLGAENGDAPVEAGLEATPVAGLKPKILAPGRGEAVLARPYVEAVLSVDLSIEPQDMPLDAMTGYVTQVVTIEGPLHEQEIINRIRVAFGLARTGARIRDAVMRAIAAGQAAGTIEGGPFWSLPGQAPLVRDRSSVAAAGLRKPEMLPDVEIEAALLAVIDANYGASREALSVATARLFGFAATSNALRERLAKALNRLLEREIVVAHNDLVRRAATPTTGENGAGTP